ncbi:MAG: hypothetical protein Q8905_17560, partial [Bacteroidota bacterium]|nr:hypothetical protein [Bacteroidota bacterium]
MKTGKNSYKKAFLGLLCLGILIVLIAVMLTTVFTSRNEPGKVTRNFNRVLQEKEKTTDDCLREIMTAFSGPPTLSPVRLPFNEESFRKSGLAFFVYRDDSLAEWTSNAVPGFSRLLRPLPAQGLIRLNNGWYEIRYIKQPPRVFAGLILIRHQYPFENDYLLNDFPSWFHVPEGTAISRTGISH